MAPPSGMVRPEQYYSSQYQYSQSTYTPPSYRKRLPGQNLNYAKECYSHLARVNSPDETIEYEKARFFVIKSFSEDNVHKSMKYQVWSSTPEGNKRLNMAYIKCTEEKAPLFLLFSVNGSRQFVGVAKMTSEVNFTERFAHWEQDGKWIGKFKIEWIFIKDIPNREFKTIIIPEENKPVTNTKDAQEIPIDQGIEMLKIFKEYKEDYNMLDAFEQYDIDERKRNESKGHKQESFAEIPYDSDREKGRHRRGRGRGYKSRRGKQEKEKKDNKEEPQGTQPKSIPEASSTTNV